MVKRVLRCETCVEIEIVHSTESNLIRLISSSEIVDTALGTIFERERKHTTETSRCFKSIAHFADR